nr:MAG TPA: hypothetical protein [Herelleviridae sp.]
MFKFFIFHFITYFSRVVWVYARTTLLFNTVAATFN